MLNLNLKMMKKFVMSIMALSLATTLIFTGCTKDEDEDVIQKTDKELVSETLLDGNFEITSLTSDPAWMMADSSLVTDLFENYLYACEQTSEYNFKSTNSEITGFKKMTLLRGSGDCYDELENRNRDGRWKLDDSKGYVELYFNYVPGDDTDALDISWKVESFVANQRVVLSQPATSDRNPTAKKWTLTLTKK